MNRDRNVLTLAEFLVLAWMLSHPDEEVYVYKLTQECQKESGTDYSQRAISNALISLEKKGMVTAQAVLKRTGIGPARILYGITDKEKACQRIKERIVHFTILVSLGTNALR